MASSVSMLALPISVFVIIFSLYPDLTTINDFKSNWYKFKSYYTICNTNKTKATFINENPDTLYSNIHSENHSNKSHLLVIDQTLSTLFKNENNFVDFKSDLQEYFMKKKIFVVDTFSLKSLLYAKLIESFINDSNCDSLYVFYYDGSKACLNNAWEFYKKKDFSISELINNRISTSLQNANTQVTNFKDIFDNIKKNLEHYPRIDCITFLSDFYHDDTCAVLTENDFIHLKEKTRKAKVNLIVLWQDKYSGRDAEKRSKCQNDFMDRFNNNFQDVVSTDKIFIDKYEDGLYNNNSNDFLEFNEAIAFNSLKNENDCENDSITVFFFSPISNSLKYNDAEVRLVVDTLRKFRWKIKCLSDNNKTFIKFRNNCNEYDTKRCVLNHWYYNTSNTLWLSIKLDNVCNYDDLKFCYIVENNNQNKFFELNIDLKKVFFSIEIKKLLLIILNIFSVLIFVFILIGGVLFRIDFFEYINSNRLKLSRQERKKNDIYWCLGILLLIILLTLLIKCFAI